MPDEERRPVAGMGEDLFDRNRQVLDDVLVDATGCPRAEVPRAPVAAEVQVEDVVTGAGEVIGEATRRQVPCVAVLAEPVDEQDGSPRAAAVRDEALPDHRQRYASPGDDQLLHERRPFVPIDRLFEGASVENQRRASSR